MTDKAEAASPIADRQHEALLLIARRVVEWMRAVDDIQDDLEYLNSGDGWDDMRETAAMAALVIAAQEEQAA